MNINCEYCGSSIETTDEVCPHCGAKNSQFARTVSTTPKTIEELKAFCESKNLKLDRMHVHIGEDFKEPKAFGIYKNESNGHFVVYKNKASGERAIRYDGTDEAYAVNELYMKLKDLLVEAKEATSGRSSRPIPQRRPTRVDQPKRSALAGFMSMFSWLLIFMVIMLVVGITALIIIARASGRSYDGRSRGTVATVANGYYEHEGYQYYKHDSNWYYYNFDDEEWRRCGDQSSILDEAEYLGDDYEDDYDVDEFPVEVYSSDWTYSDSNDNYNDSYDSYNDWDDDDWDDDDYDWDDSYDDYDWGDSDWDSDWRIRFDFGDII